MPFLCPEARCSRFCARWWVCTMVEPQHMPSVPAEAVCLALSRVRWGSMPVASAEAVCVPFLCPMEGVCTRSHDIEPQHMPSVAAEAVCLAPCGVLCR